MPTSLGGKGSKQGVHDQELRTWEAMRRAYEHEMREADGQEELLSGKEPKGYYRDAQVTDAVRRGQRQKLEKEPNGLHSGTPSTW